ncbi:hypothetical protein PPACK8108_LOCUS11342 [Phakopsora pachyrhizi]|uniref:RRM domain-containing protein n=1 Tax=Phakopsora pachyrhizi TaxID=170000 RepID=A0AAV0B217_PHAPC|nr:hypothetical protein PPACK8108_LOCUS11342 [Phakopsora pachyrhizi]
MEAVASQLEQSQNTNGDDGNLGHQSFQTNPPVGDLSASNGTTPTVNPPTNQSQIPTDEGISKEIALTNGEQANVSESNQEEKVDEIPADASETVYLNNLNEKVKLPVLKQTLKNLLKNFGTVLDVVAHRSLRMRGQAFVAFADREVAAKVVKEIKGFPLYGKPIEIAFARSAADVVVKRKTPDEFEAHKAERLLKKKRSRRENPLRKKAFAQKQAALKAADSTSIPGGAASATANSGPSAASSRRVVQMPDEYQPPNKILFVQNLPENAGKDALEVLFKQYPGLVEVRTIPGRANIAFVEYVDSTNSGVAKDALHNYKFDGEHRIKVTFAKQ